MAVVENGGSIESNDVDQSESSVLISRSNDNHQSFHQEKNIMTNVNGTSINGNGVASHQQHQMVVNGVDRHDHEEEDFKKEMRDLEEMLSKLNPMAEEFVPPSLSNNSYNRTLVQSPSVAGHFGYAAANDFLLQTNHTAFFNVNGISTGRKKGNFSSGKRRMNSRTNMAQREDAIKRTVHVSDIDQQVTEEQLAALFINCGQVVDCRVCGDPNSVLRFAFIEFTDEEGAKNALSLAGTMLGFYPVRVLPSKTAIAPVNPTFLPRSEDEREMCARTIYCTNIDKKVTQADVKLFFESLCGEVYRLRLLGDYHHSSRIAFVEFVMAESAIAALNCSGAVLGSLPIRVSPSKTPVRPRTPRPTMH
ncbi:polyadenylate-binding protein-interacting protein 12-like isoform X1 [Cynara cardunculus var. scolymus]|uniref:Ataxin-2, C-terminal n=1 Tax=Cynara cardunculus var. scolymus TaxID=59895 RepID=A0A103XIN2_CYNCS|nr:polyadenylate-binding protein-interacting protein 12-like isoform X1 [Cynara cardunculus var. scolymus]XP_024996089.1 polyadenylate-binding protein-interacting protein 12-like isoform X1 [Cynara cardunculus var. scolymus]KVH91475.1 Ataxin-2, C-terminal [Cynara cardunculus var. scolymus]